MEYAAEFEENKAEYEGQNGYMLQLEAARLAMDHLAEVCRLLGDAKKAKILTNLASRYRTERNSIIAEKRW